MKYLVSIGGASGSMYGIRLLEELKNAHHEVHCIISKGAKAIIEYETSYTIQKIINLADISYDNSDLFAAPASGSYQLDAMIIAPCSMKTLSAIANGYADTLTSRAAFCFLKENRKLILVVRETPLDLSAIKNMLSARQNGAIILPAMPGFYHHPKNIDDIINFVVGKTLDQLNIKHTLFKRWK